jgi:hypothetical protein
VRSASSRDSRRFSVSPSSMAVPRSMAKSATSSSGFTPCILIVCARLRSAAPLGRQGLLAGAEGVPAAPVEAMDDDELLAELEGAAGDAEITELRPVRSTAEKRAAEEIANRTPCKDFDEFKPLFEQVRRELEFRHPEDATLPDDGRRRRPDRLCGRGGRRVQDGV